jgi:hypothetical protein
MRTAATGAVVLLVVVAGFQILLALGAPLGRAAWGGKHEGALPAQLRFASAVAGILLYPAMIVLVLDVSGLRDFEWVPETGATAMWILAGFFALGTLANFVSRSPAERLLGPVSLALASCFAVIAATL